MLGSGLGLRLGLGLGLGLTLVSPVIACLVEVYGAELGRGLFRLGVRSWGPPRRRRAQRGRTSNPNPNPNQP